MSATFSIAAIAVLIAPLTGLRETERRNNAFGLAKVATRPSVRTGAFCAPRTTDAVDASAFGAAAVVAAASWFAN